MAVRRVRRIIRRIDPWTVLKVSLVFNAVVALVFVLGSWVTWSMALRRGIPERVVDIFESLTLTISVEGELYFRIIVLLAIIGAILATAFMTLGAVLYNLIADLVGGIEIAVLEETYKPMATRTRVSPVDRPAPSAPAAATPEKVEPPARRAAGSPAGEPSSPVPDRPLVPAAGAGDSQAPGPAGDRAAVPERTPAAGNGRSGSDREAQAADGEVSRVRAG